MAATSASVKSRVRPAILPKGFWRRKSCNHRVLLCNRAATSGSVNSAGAERMFIF